MNLEERCEQMTTERNLLIRENARLYAEVARLQAIIDRHLAPVYDATDETIIGYAARDWEDL